MGTDLDRAIEDYLTFLRVERGLAPATLRAYRADLDDFAARAIEPRLVARAGRGRPLPCRPDEARPTARSGPRADEPPAARRGDPRLLQVRVRRRPDPRGRRRAPGPPADAAATPGDPDRRGRRAAARGGRCRGGRPISRACAIARSWSCCMPRGCGSPRRSACDREDLSIEAAFVRVIGKGDRERLVPVGDVALGVLGRWIAGPRAALLAMGHVQPVRGGPLFLGDRGRRLARQQAWATVKRAAARRRPGRPGEPAHPAPFVCDAPARGRR